jgi:hypothetical protein
MLMRVDEEPSLKEFPRKLNMKEESQNPRETNGRGDALLSMKKHLVCALCKKRGHRKSECWTKRESSRNGDPRKQENKPTDKKKIVCYGCGKDGHYKKDCKNPKKNDRVALLSGPIGTEPEGRWIADG